MKWFSRRPVITDEHWDATVQQYPIVGRRPSGEQAALRRLADRFLRSMQIRWAAGLQPRDEVQVALAALACLPILNLDWRWYRRWRTVLLVPSDYETESVEIDAAGVVHEGTSNAAGEFSEMGTVVLSLEDLRRSGQGSGFNVVIHECAHVLDSANGALDGVPPLHGDMDRALWSTTCGSALQDLQRRVVRGKTHGGRRRSAHRTSFDPYAAESPEEFFAVASELFFERPRNLVREYPQVYQQLALFYRQGGTGSD